MVVHSYKGELYHTPSRRYNVFPRGGECQELTGDAVGALLDVEEGQPVQSIGWLLASSAFDMSRRATYNGLHRSTHLLSAVSRHLFPARAVPPPLQVSIILGVPELALLHNLELGHGFQEHEAILFPAPPKLT